jgi:serine/threonine-protein kinase
MDSTASTGPMPPAAAPGLDLTGRTLADFHVLRRLGEGGMGQVYLAEQVSLKRKVALKILRADLAANPASLQRFKAEAEAVARATHANIVQVYACGEADGLPYIALEYVEGRNLAEYLAKRGPPDLPQALSIMRQTAAALQRAGELGVIHRDVKPENILMTRKGEVKVTDFGLSRVLAGDMQPLNLTQSGVTMGTPLYMSPEQVEGKPVDSRTDIYSLGVTCYHMLTGRPPFQGATAFEVALQHVRDEPKPLQSVRPDLPAALCAMVHKMMAKDPAQRYQTGRELLRDLARLRESLSASAAGAAQPGLSVDLPSGSVSASTPAPPASRPLAPPAPPNRRGWLAAAVVLSLVAAAGVGAAVGWPRRAPDEPPTGGAAPDAVDADDFTPPLTDEEATRTLVDKYLQQPQPPTGPNLSTSLGLCVDLGVLYLEQHRLDDAEKLFTRLDGMRDTHPYYVLGHLGRAIVAALRDDSKESNRLFKEFSASQRDRGKPDPEVMRKIWNNPSFRFWLSQAMFYNHRNGLPDADMPPGLLKLRDPAGRP